jgi:hypothetical protein
MSAPREEKDTTEEALVHLGPAARRSGRVAATLLRWIRLAGVLNNSPSFFDSFHVVRH